MNELEIGFVIGRTLPKLVIGCLIIYTLIRWITSTTKKNNSSIVNDEDIDVLMLAKKEFDTESVDDRLYLKAEIEANGDEKLTRLKYIELRASQIAKEKKSFKPLEEDEASKCLPEGNDEAYKYIPNANYRKPVEEDEAYKYLPADSKKSTSLSPNNIVILAYFFIILIIFLILANIPL